MRSQGSGVLGRLLRRLLLGDLLLVVCFLAATFFLPAFLVTCWDFSDAACAATGTVAAPMKERRANAVRRAFMFVEYSDRRGCGREQR
jgi:hypothetical protein